MDGRARNIRTTRLQSLKIVAFIDEEQHVVTNRENDMEEMNS
ncbi:hypothetical protein [Macrococcus brunensis]|nr:hypothetical protein [Macrococcus brunensis]